MDQAYTSVSTTPDFSSSSFGLLTDVSLAYTLVDIHVTPRNGHHPYIQGNYKTCSTIKHQVSVKNSESFRDIQQVLDMLHSRSGRKITKITTPVLTDTPSIQGVWTPFLSLAEEQPKIRIHGDGER